MRILAEGWSPRQVIRFPDFPVWDIVFHKPKNLSQSRVSGVRGGFGWRATKTIRVAERSERVSFMVAKAERARGAEILTNILSGGGILHVSEPRIYNNGYAYYFEVTAQDKVADFCLSAEVLEDLQGMPKYQQQTNSFARAVEKRLRNPKPNGFMTITGVPLEVETFWPHEAWVGRTASLVRTSVCDLRTSMIPRNG
jgi:hypothetical protein